MACYFHFEIVMQVGQLGISNIYDLEALQAIFQQARVKPAVVQNR
jgi:diketogulonate reductase-like aldo/keto reductase